MPSTPLAGGRRGGDGWAPMELGTPAGPGGHGSHGGHGHGGAAWQSLAWEAGSALESGKETQQERAERLAQ